MDAMDEGRGGGEGGPREEVYRPGSALVHLGIPGSARFHPVPPGSTSLVAPGSCDSETGGDVLVQTLHDDSYLLGPPAALKEALKRLQTLMTEAGLELQPHSLYSTGGFPSAFHDGSSSVSSGGSQPGAPWQARPRPARGSPRRARRRASPPRPPAPPPAGTPTAGLLES